LISLIICINIGSWVVESQQGWRDGNYDCWKERAMNRGLVLTGLVLFTFGCRHNGANDVRPKPIEITCNWSLSRCEAAANEECKYDGFVILGSYRTNTLQVVPKYHMKVLCGKAGV